LIADNAVTIFSKSWCPYCQAAKGLFGSLGVHEEGKSVSESDKQNTDLELAGLKYKTVECVDLAHLANQNCLLMCHFISRLDLVEDGDAIQDYLKTRDGQRTVPNIYISAETSFFPHVFR